MQALFVYSTPYRDMQPNRARKKTMTRTTTKKRTMTTMRTATTSDQEQRRHLEGKCIEARSPAKEASHTLLAVFEAYPPLNPNGIPQRPLFLTGYSFVSRSSLLQGQSCFIGPFEACPCWFGVD